MLSQDTSPDSVQAPANDTTKILLHRIENLFSQRLLLGVQVVDRGDGSPDEASFCYLFGVTQRFLVPVGTAGVLYIYFTERMAELRELNLHLDVKASKHSFRVEILDNTVESYERIQRPLLKELYQTIRLALEVPHNRGVRLLFNQRKGISSLEILGTAKDIIVEVDPLVLQQFTSRLLDLSDEYEITTEAKSNDNFSIAISPCASAA